MFLRKKYRNKIEELNTTVESEVLEEMIMAEFLKIVH